MGESPNVGYPLGGGSSRNIRTVATLSQSSVSASMASSTTWQVQRGTCGYGDVGSCVCGVGVGVRFSVHARARARRCGISDHGWVASLRGRDAARNIGVPTPEPNAVHRAARTVPRSRKTAARSVACRAARRSCGPEAPNSSQHMIPSTNQLPISMVNRETTAHGQCGVGWS